MSTIVIKVPTSTIQRMQQFYQRELLAKKVPYTVFVAKKGQRRSLLIRLEKVMFQGATAEKEASLWGDTASAVPDKKKAPVSTTALPAGFSEKASSAVTRSATAVISVLWWSVPSMPKEQLPQLKALGVKDSKMLTDPEIRKMAPKIKELVPYQLLTVTPSKYNEIQPKYNTVRMKVALHNQAIRLLLQKLLLRHQMPF